MESYLYIEIQKKLLSFIDFFETFSGVFVLHKNCSNSGKQKKISLPTKFEIQDEIKAINRIKTSGQSKKEQGP